MFVNCLGQNEQSLQRTFHRCFLPSFGSFGQAVSEEKNIEIPPIRNKNRLWWPCFLMNRDRRSNLNRGLSIDGGVLEAYLSVIQFRENCILIINKMYLYLNQSYLPFNIRNKNRLRWPYLLTDQDDISNLNRGPSIDATYPVSVHLAKRFQRRIFQKIGQLETRIACGGHVC